MKQSIHKTTTLLLLGSLFILLSALSGMAGHFVVVVNNSVPNDSLDSDSMQKIFLGKKSRWIMEKKSSPSCSRMVMCTTRLSRKS